MYGLTSLLVQMDLCTHGQTNTDTHTQAHISCTGPLVSIDVVSKWQQKHKGRQQGFGNANIIVELQSFLTSASNVEASNRTEAKCDIMNTCISQRFRQ